MPSLSPMSSPQLPGSAPKILVIDDDPTMRLLLERLLARDGFQVLHAARLKEAREALAREAIALILIDGLLPDGTGPAFISELRAQQTSAKILFLSAFYRDIKTFTSLTRELRVDGVLHKPIEASALSEQVHRLLDAPRPRTPGGCLAPWGRSSRRSRSRSRRRWPRSRSPRCARRGGPRRGSGRAAPPTSGSPRRSRASARGSRCSTRTSGW